MFAEERIEEIIKILNSEGKVKVKELSSLFEVSEDSIRKDLQKLERMGIMERTYGGGVLPRKTHQMLSLSARKREHADIKKKIAEKAFEIIKDNETIFLEISTINIFLAEFISRSNKRLTVITNMVDVIKALENSSNVDLICTGGSYSAATGGFIGSETIGFIQKYKVDRTFIGSCGVNIFDKSIATAGSEDGNTKKAAVSAAKLSYLLMENEKFSYDGIYSFASLSDIRAIVTEERPSDEICDALKNMGVELL